MASKEATIWQMILGHFMNRSIDAASAWTGIVGTSLSAIDFPYQLHVHRTMPLDLMLLMQQDHEEKDLNLKKKVPVENVEFD